MKGSPSAFKKGHPRSRFESRIAAAGGSSRIVSNSLRIAVLVNPFMLHAKGGAHAPRLAKALRERGHVVRGFGAPPGTFASEADAEEEAQGGLERFDPQAILAYDALSPAAWMGARQARRSGCPLVLVESGFTGSGPIHARFLRRAGEAMWGSYIRHTAQAVACLDPYAVGLAESEGFHAERIHQVPVGVDLERYRPGLSSSLLASHRVSGRVLLYVGRLDDRRGLETIIEAFGNTVGQRGDWSLVLAGEGGARRRLGALSHRLGVGARIHWLGLPSHEDRPGLIASATLLAVPALDESVRGKQIPRALACGVPVLASDLPRFREIVAHGERGLLVPPGDVEAWTAALRMASSSPEARRRWSRAGREYAQRELSWDAVATNFEGLIAHAEIEARARRELPSAR